MFVVTKPTVARWRFNKTLVVRRSSWLERLVLAIPLKACEHIGIVVMAARIGYDMHSFSEIGLLNRNRQSL